MSKRYRKPPKDKDLSLYIPDFCRIGIYTYDIEIRRLISEAEENEGECCFRSKRIFLSDELCYDLDDPNYKLTIEVLMHEILHAYNFNVGLHSNFFDFTNKKSLEIEETFVDLHARHFAQMIVQNPELLKILNLLVVE